MGAKRFGLMGAAGFMLLGAWVMGVEKDNPGTTSTNAGAVKDVTVQVAAEGAAVVPELQQAVGPAVAAAGNMVSGATAAASGAPSAEGGGAAGGDAGTGGGQQ